MPVLPVLPLLPLSGADGNLVSIVRRSVTPPRLKEMNMLIKKIEVNHLKC
jgi:hypothetical protein